MTLTSPPNRKGGKEGRRTPVAKITLTAVMTALVFVVTQFFWVPISAVPGQRFDAGDIMVFIAAWTFGPFVGAFAGGVGSSLSDAYVGGAPYWPFTLVIKGFEGYLAGFLIRRGGHWWPRLSWVLASTAMVGGYFLTNALLIGFFVSPDSGLNPQLSGALLEVPFDIVQVAAGGLLGRPASRYLKRALPYSILGTNSQNTGKM